VEDHDTLGVHVAGRGETSVDAQELSASSTASVSEDPAPEYRHEPATGPAAALGNFSCRGSPVTMRSGSHRASTTDCVEQAPAPFLESVVFRWMPCPHHSPKWRPGPSMSSSSACSRHHAANPKLSCCAANPAALAAARVRARPPD
jgi:hypothetical protein